MLVHVWAGLVALAVILYVLLDGMTLGIGLLFPFAGDDAERDTMMNSIAPVWDANQTWLVFGAGAVFTAFPVVYGTFSTALYVPLMTFVMGLIFRGVTFEFRARSRHKLVWSTAFVTGSLVAVLSQGLMLGGLVSGIVVSPAGISVAWLSPFSVLIALGLAAGYILLGACYLIIKTAGGLQRRAYGHATWSLLVVLAIMAAVTFWTPFHFPQSWRHWTTPPRLYFVWCFPVIGLTAAVLFLRAVRRRAELLPLACAVALFLSGYLGLLASLYPYAIPPDVTITAAAAQHETMRFTLWGAAIVLPVVIAYAAYSHWVFRGKVGEEPAYEA